MYSWRGCKENRQLEERTQHFVKDEKQKLIKARKNVTGKSLDIWTSQLKAAGRKCRNRVSWAEILEGMWIQLACPVLL